MNDGNAARIAAALERIDNELEALRNTIIRVNLGPDYGYLSVNAFKARIQDERLELKKDTQESLELGKSARKKKESPETEELSTSDGTVGIIFDGMSDHMKYLYENVDELFDEEMVSIDKIKAMVLKVLDDVVREVTGSEELGDEVNERLDYFRKQKGEGGENWNE